jgi:hypothetical protein
MFFFHQPLDSEVYPKDKTDVYFFSVPILGSELYLGISDFGRRSYTETIIPSAWKKVTTHQSSRIELVAYIRGITG